MLSFIALFFSVKPAGPSEPQLPFAKLFFAGWSCSIRPSASHFFFSPFSFSSEAHKFENYHRIVLINANVICLTLSLSVILCFLMRNVCNRFNLFPSCLFVCFVCVEVEVTVIAGLVVIGLICLLRLPHNRQPPHSLIGCNGRGGEVGFN